MATAPPRPDAVLVRRLRGRDRPAWEDVYAEYGSRLRAFGYRLTGNTHDADDLVQETFVRALPRLDRLDPDTVELGPYLFTTLRNLFLKSVERGRRSEPMADVPEPAVPAPIEDDPERSTLLHRQQEEVRSANARLAPRQRLVLALRELEDRSYAEIGIIVGLNENAVAQLISRARESLRVELRLAQVDPERLSEACRRFLPLLHRHLDGQLRGVRLEETLAHLEACESCRDSLASMQEAQRRYRVLLPLLGSGEELRERVDGELTSAGYWSSPPKAGRRLRGRGAVMACGALLALGGAGVGASVLLADDEPGAVGAAPSVAASTSAVRATALGQTTTPRPAPLTTRARFLPPEPRPPLATTTTPVTPRATVARVTTTTSTTTITAAVVPTTPVVAPPSRPSLAVSTTAKVPASSKVEPPVRKHVAVKPTLQPKPRPKPKPKPHPKPHVAPPPPAATTIAPSLDTTAPTVTILAQPPAETTSGEASFSFSASEPGATLSCRLDAAAFAPCSSPATSQGLAPGAHSFAVRATDAAQNTGPAAVADWTVLPPPDATPPTVAIVTASTTGSDATFEFTASEAGSAFSCSLDGGAFEACASPRAYSDLAPGVRTFAVQATDAAGNTSVPATYSWTVAAPLPDLVVSALAETSFTVTNAGTAAAGPFVVSVTLIGTFTFSGLAPGQSETRVWVACRVGTLTVVADRGAAVAESDEGNNTRSLVSDC